MGDISREEAASEWQAAHGGTKVVSGSIVAPN
jgi:hypothetical protein